MNSRLHRIWCAVVLAAAFTSCQTARDYAVLWNIEHLNGLQHQFKPVVDQTGMVYEETR